MQAVPGQRRRDAARGFPDVLMDFTMTARAVHRPQPGPHLHLESRLRERGGRRDDRRGGGRSSWTARPPPHGVFPFLRPLPASFEISTRSRQTADPGQYAFSCVGPRRRRPGYDVAGKAVWASCASTPASELLVGVLNNTPNLEIDLKGAIRRKDLRRCRRRASWAAQRLLENYLT